MAAGMLAGLALPGAAGLTMPAQEPGAGLDQLFLAEIRGTAQVSDGDTLRVGESRIRLFAGAPTEALPRGDCDSRAGLTASSAAPSRSQPRRH